MGMCRSSESRFHLLTVNDFQNVSGLDVSNSEIYLDEVMTVWLARDWSKMNRNLINWFSQHRKYRVNFTYIAQSIDRVDSTLRDMTQEYILMRNTKFWKFSFLRFPEVLLAIHYAEDRKTVLKRRFYTISKEITSIYDSWAVFDHGSDQSAPGGVVVPIGVQARSARAPSGANKDS